MPDPFDKKESPTQPDLGRQCPACEGEGSRLVDISDRPDRTRMVRRRCATCEGRKRISSEEFARYLARPTGQ